MAKVYNKHPQEFKDNAVNMVLRQKLPKAQVARDLGVSHSTLDRWILNQEKPLSSKTHSAGGVEESDRIKALEKELEDLKIERDILKKAAAYFAKESL